MNREMMAVAMMGSRECEQYWNGKSEEMHTQSVERTQRLLDGTANETDIGGAIDWLTDKLPTRADAIEYAKRAWADKFRIANDGSMDEMTYSEYAEMIIQSMDEAGEDDEFDEVDLAMECWARDNWTGTIWE